MENKRLEDNACYYKPVKPEDGYRGLAEKPMDRTRLSIRFDMAFDLSLYHDLVKWDFETKNFSKKGPYYTSDEHEAAERAVHAILRDYFEERHRGRIAWNGTLRWDPRPGGESRWIAEDDQGDTMDDVWPESAGFSHGDSFEVLLGKNDWGDVWFQTEIRQDSEGVWRLDGTGLSGQELEGLRVRQDRTFTQEEIRELTRTWRG